MLVELVVENLAVVERLRAAFHPGLNVLTGETGSGKSLVVDALGLLFGGRSSADLIRAGAPKLFVSGRFELPGAPALSAIPDAAGIGAGLGMPAVWTAMILDWVVRGVILSWRFRRLALRSVRL